MTDKEFFLDVLLRDIMKIAKVNLYTGEYVFIKKIDTEVERRCLKQPTIDKYVSKIVNEGVLHPQDVQNFIHFTNIERIRQQAENGKMRFVHSYRRRFGEIYTWITVVISIPDAFSAENPWVIFRWEITDDDHHMLEDSLKILSSIFHKILKVNLTEDNFAIIKGYDDEMNEQQGYNLKISEWLRQFALCGNVHEEDRQAFLKFSDMNYLRARFKEGREYLRIRYRRRTNGSFRWVSMELVPSTEYSDDNQVIMLYIRDIHDEYISELHYNKELEYYCNSDILTGLWNRYYYNKFLQHLIKMDISGIGIVFADLNGLKQINDNEGHGAGDDFLKSFAVIFAREFGKESCCRISGDEFIAWQENISREEFEAKTEHFRKLVEKDGKPIASVGAAWSDDAFDAERVVKDAESSMYKEKQKFYKAFPKERR